MGGVNAGVGGVNGGVKAGIAGVKAKLSEAIDAASIRASKATLSKLRVLLLAIANSEGERVPFYQKTANIGSTRTVERHLEYLRDVGLVQFRGKAPKNGWVFLLKAEKGMEEGL